MTTKEVHGNLGPDVGQALTTKETHGNLGPYIGQTQK